MPYDGQEEEGVIRSGNLRQWLAYKVGGHNIPGVWIVGAAVLVAFVLGALVF